MDTNYQVFTGCKNLKGTVDVAQINHYFTKTVEEYTTIKIPRGKADGKDNSICINEAIRLFINRNKNQIEDLHAKNFMYGSFNDI